MQTTFTRTERLVSGLYFAAMAAGGFFALIIAAGSAAFLGYYLWAFPIGGFMAGIFIIPAIIKPDQFLKTRSFAAGCLTLLISCLTISFLLGIRGGIDLIKGLSLNWNDITFSFVRDWFENTITFAGLSLITSIPYVLIYGPAGMLFSYLLFRYRQKNKSEIIL